VYSAYLLLYSIRQLAESNAVQHNSMIGQFLIVETAVIIALRALVPNNAQCVLSNSIFNRRGLAHGNAELGRKYGTAQPSSVTLSEFSV
jgi:hypothetical protein